MTVWMRETQSCNFAVGHNAGGLWMHLGSFYAICWTGLFAVCFGKVSRSGLTTEATEAHEAKLCVCGGGGLRSDFVDPRRGGGGFTHLSSSAEGSQQKVDQNKAVAENDDPGKTSNASTHALETLCTPHTVDFTGRAV